MRILIKVPYVRYGQGGSFDKSCVYGKQNIPLPSTEGHTNCAPHHRNVSYIANNAHAATLVGRQRRHAVDCVGKLGVTRNAPPRHVVAGV